MAYRGQPGLSVGIVYDQRLIWSAGYGLADVERGTPAATDTLYRIASITKLFTSTAIMQLRDQGSLQLDDPVEKHLPWFSIDNPFTDSPQPTIRHLLTHAGGLPREAAFPYWNDGKFPSEEEIQATVSEQELALAPGSDWKYSNLGLSLAGRIIEEIAEMPYAAYVTKHILRPLGMKSTTVEAIAPDHPQLATGYGRRLPDGSREQSPYTNCRGIGPAANMASSVEDLAKFIMLQFRDGPRNRGKQILAGSSLREMQRAHWLNENWSAGRGLGFYVWRLNGRTLVGHGGALLGYRTELHFSPSEKVGAIALTNADDGMPLLYAEKIFEWIVPAILEVVKPNSKPAEAEEEWGRYVGRYRNRWGDSQVLIHNRELIVITPAAPDPLNSRITLKALGPHSFTMTTSEHFSVNGEVATFELDKEGKVVRLRLGNNYTFPVEMW